MKTKSVTVTVGLKLGLPGYSSVNTEVSEIVELDDGETRSEVIEKTHRRLTKFVEGATTEAEARFLKDHKIKK